MEKRLLNKHLLNNLTLLAEKAQTRQFRQPPTRAYLIGTGPGDIEYLTLRAVRAIGSCDVLLVDDLVNRQVLQFASPNCKILSVGKKPGKHSITQVEIEELFLRELELGKIVGRLKGGDPFVFGRGGEEIIMLAQKNISFEIVSGITAGIAAPAALGIPITHRGMAQSATFVTGHSCDAASKPKWKALVDSGSTLIIYMGVARLEPIAQVLQECGMPGTMPAALIENATLACQRSIRTTLGSLVKESSEHAISAPSIVIIGAVVSIADSLSSWQPQLEPDLILGEGQSATVLSTASQMLQEIKR